MITTSMLIYLRDNYRSLTMWDPHRLTIAQLRTYALQIENAGGPEGIWGFIDGTIRGISRPVKRQEDYYTGYKKGHGIKFQAIMIPDGLISHLSGP